MKTLIPLDEQVKSQQGQISDLREQLDQAMMALQFEDMGWLKLTGIKSVEEGLTLEQLHGASRTTREVVAGSVLMKRAVALRVSYVWSKGVNVPGTERSTKPGQRSKLERFFWDKTNQKTLFSPDAKQKVETALATDGVFLLLGDKKTRKIRGVPLSDIEEVYLNPEFKGEIWAYLRRWTEVVNGKDVEKREWVFTDEYVGSLPKNLGSGANEYPVNPDKTFLDLWANQQVGWAFGVPDALPATAWVREYTTMIEAGITMTEALAKLVAKVKVKSKSGSDRVGVKMSQGGVARTATYAEGNEIDIFSSAGKTYDFNGVRPIAALIATGMEVSIIHLLSDPGAAGSSYGSASNLDLPTKRAMVSRQNMWAAFISRVVEWGSGERVDVSFPSLDDPDPYREAQLAALAWNTGLFHPEEIRNRFIQVLGISTENESAPTGVLLPNNEDSWERKDIDPSDAPGTPTSSASPDQGQSNRSGGTDSGLSNDQRTDTVESMRREMAFSEQIGEMKEMMARLETLIPDTNK